MIKPVPTACTLLCDNCNREYNFGTRHVFKSPNQATMFAMQHGWRIEDDNHALCPECLILKNQQQ